MSLLNIKNIFLQEKAKDYKVTKEILSNNPEAKITYVKSHWNIPELNGNKELLKQWNKVKREYLVLGVKSGIDFKDNGRSTDFIAPSHANGCSMACTYCYVARRKGYANPLTVFVNIEELLSSMRKHSQALGWKVPNQCDPKYWTYDIGCNNDASVDALVSNNVRDIVELFKELPNAKASFATKYVNNDMLSYDPQRKTRIRFSLMPERIARVVDVRTSTIKDRIQAIQPFFEAGYEVHLNFSPVIVYQGWEQDYIDLMKQVDSTLSQEAKDQLAAEVIFLTHNKDLHELNEIWHPKGESLLWAPGIQEPKKSLYGGDNLRYKWKLKRQFIDSFKRISAAEMPYMNIRYIF